MQKAALYPMDVPAIFDNNICSSSQMPREYLITMLLPAIGHFVNGSQIRTNTGTPTNISFFTTIIGYPSVNKSSATEAILNAVLVIEKHLGIKTEESRINCSATVEQLLTELKNRCPRLIQVWDEAVTLLQSFGLYKQGGAAYDRSIMCTLYNSSAVVKRQTKSGNITVENPVLNIAAAAHPADIFSSVSNESDDDGLMTRFLFSAPEPCIPLSGEIRSLNIDEPSLNHLLYIIHCFNSTEQNDWRRNDDEDQRIIYSYSADTQKVFNDAFDEYTLQIREAYGIDQGLGSILGKAKVQVSKIAGALHAVSLAAAVFDQLINDDSLPGYYEKRPVHETLDEMRQRFEQNRDEQERIERNHEVVAESRRSKVSMRSDDGSEQRYPEKVILPARGTKIPWINKSLSHGGYKAATLHQAAANLQSENLGLLTKEKNTGAHRATTYFSKVLIDQKWDVETLTIFCTKLAKYNVSLVAYRASLKPEITVSTTETEDDDSMDAFPRREDVLIRMSPPPVPSRNLIQTTTTPIASYGFRLPPSVNSVRSQQRIETQATQSFSTNDMETTEITTFQLAPQAKKKNRIEQIDKPTSPFSSPRRHIPKSQEYPYQNV
ncbi:unnamed protein product [Rotaria magnacalcarata]|uniref:Uncharacterized protein n=4 Tax=Rotaria magnacalcarata TaxID=392030 RepID=A0A816MU55_9BILA|nr:unnamed protein product [Rotaria magnacalcarata]CAF4252348.1 unnamed protein product [Rotaria magnacalcarata]